MIDKRSTSQEISSAHPSIAVLGIGAIEQHGRHLPVGTDWMIVDELSRRVAHELNALLIPAIPFSMSECHGMLGGTVWLKPATLSAVLQDVVSSLHAQGICNLTARDPSLKSRRWICMPVKLRPRSSCTLTRSWSVLIGLTSCHRSVVSFWIM